LVSDEDGCSVTVSYELDYAMLLYKIPLQNIMLYTCQSAIVLLHFRIISGQQEYTTGQ